MVIITKKKYKPIYSWRTKKVNEGYKYEVIKITPLDKPDKKGYYAKTNVLKSEVLSSRARAKSKAQRLVRLRR